MYAVSNGIKVNKFNLNDSRSPIVYMQMENSKISVVWKVVLVIKCEMTYTYESRNKTYIVGKAITV